MKNNKHYLLRNLIDVRVFFILVMIQHSHIYKMFCIICSIVHEAEDKTFNLSSHTLRRVQLTAQWVLLQNILLQVKYMYEYYNNVQYLINNFAYGESHYCFCAGGILHYSAWWQCYMSFSCQKWLKEKENGSMLEEHITSHLYKELHLDLD